MTLFLCNGGDLWYSYGHDKTDLWTTLLGTNISPTKAFLKMTFLFPRWDILVPSGVSTTLWNFRPHHQIFRFGTILTPFEVVHSVTGNFGGYSSYPLNSVRPSGGIPKPQTTKPRVTSAGWSLWFAQKGVDVRMRKSFLHRFGGFQSQQKQTYNYTTPEKTRKNKNCSLRDYILLQCTILVTGSLIGTFLSSVLEYFSKSHPRLGSCLYSQKLHQKTGGVPMIFGVTKTSDNPNGWLELTHSFWWQKSETCQTSTHQIRAEVVWDHSSLTTLKDTPTTCQWRWKQTSATCHVTFQDQRWRNATDLLMVTMFPWPAKMYKLWTFNAWVP